MRSPTREAARAPRQLPDPAPVGVHDEQRAIGPPTAVAGEDDLPSVRRPGVRVVVHGSPLECVSCLSPVPSVRTVNTLADAGGPNAGLPKRTLFPSGEQSTVPV